MTFEEVWVREYLLLGGTANKSAARRLWDTAVAEQKERDAKIVQDFPLAESVWSKPAKAGIAAAIRGQQP